MQVAVWDTYVKKEDGHVLHFDVIVPETQKNADKILGYAQRHCHDQGVVNPSITTDECQFCHLEAPSEEMVRNIEAQGHFILEMDEIPATLPDNPSRREVILYLRAHCPEYRFDNFKGKSLEEVLKMLPS